MTGSSELIMALPTRVFAFLQCGPDILLQCLTGMTGHIVRKLGLEVLQTFEGFFRPRQLKEAFGETEVSLQVAPVQLDGSDAVTQCGVHVTVPGNTHNQLHSHAVWRSRHRPW